MSFKEFFYNIEEAKQEAKKLKQARNILGWDNVEFAIMEHDERGIYYIVEINHDLINN